MNPADLEGLPPEARVAAILELAREALGPETVDALEHQLRPIIENAVGHGRPQGRRTPGDARVPARNFWQGHWQVFEAD